MRSSRDNVALGSGQKRKPRGHLNSPSPNGDGNQSWRYGKQMRTDGIVVNCEQPKGLIGCGQNGKGTGIRVCSSRITDVAPSSKSQYLTLRVQCEERGKPVILLFDIIFTPNREESEPQGEPMELRVKDVGKSECQPVTGRIGIASKFRQHHLTRKRADFRLVRRHEITCQKSQGDS